MSTLQNDAAGILMSAGFDVRQIHDGGDAYLTFENETVLGLVFAYETPADLLQKWETDSRRAIDDHRLALRRSAQKAWNAYVVLLAEKPCVDFEAVRLAAIEEDLTGTRKIARAGVEKAANLKEALLPLLPLQAPPRLDAVDSNAEIERRTTALDKRVVAAFLSTATQAVLFSIMEGNE